MKTKTVLASYLAVLMTFIATGATQKDTGAWEVASTISKIDDTKTVMLSLEADAPIKGWLEETVPILVIRCKEGKLDVFIVTGLSANPELGLHDEVTVLLRFDKEKAERYRWGEATSGETLFCQKSGSNMRKFITKMMGHEKLLFQFTPYNSSPATTTFSLTGLENVIGELKTACGWKDKSKKKK